MVFVNELIPESEKRNLPFPVTTRLSGAKPTLWKWTIDRERDAYLVLARREGGGYEGTEATEHYVLSWKGELIKFSGISRTLDRPGVGSVLVWNILNVTLPPALMSDMDFVRNLIVEALDAMGLLYRRDRIKEVVIEFDNCAWASGERS